MVNALTWSDLFARKAKVIHSYEYIYFKIFYIIDKMNEGIIHFYEYISF